MADTDVLAPSRDKVSWVTELIYVADPMCSWCWGFSPSIEAVASHHPDVPIRLVMGGLRPGAAAEPLDDRMRSYLAGAWRAVAERSGQPFDHSFLEREGWTYDTEQAAVAVVAMRRLDESLALPFLTTVQRAFYAGGTDVTHPTAYPDLVDEFPVDGDVFIETMHDEVTRKMTWGDFSLSRRWGISGFPALLGRDGDHAEYLIAGWASPEDTDRALHEWLDGHGGALQDGALCDVDGQDC